MYLILRSLLSSLINPLLLFWMLLLVGLVLYWIKRKRFSKWVLTASFFWLLIISTHLLPRLLLSSLENKYDPINIESFNKLAPDTSVHILVLGNNYEFDKRVSFSGLLSNSGISRLVEGVRIHLQIPESTLVFSGYTGGQPWAQGFVSRNAAIELGVDSSAVATLPYAWNTRAEAEAYNKKYGNNYNLILVTDAAHMPRAMMHFYKVGLDPTPAPTNFRIRENSASKNLSFYLPQSRNIFFTELFLYENIGRIWAWLGGN